MKGASAALEQRVRELQLLHETAGRLTSLLDVRELLPELDEGALGAFFDHYFERVHGYLRRLVREEFVPTSRDTVGVGSRNLLDEYLTGRHLTGWRDGTRRGARG